MPRTPANFALCNTAIAAAVAATAMVALSQGSLAQQPPTPTAFSGPYQVVTAIPPPSGKIASFDISFVDPVLGRYYVASRTGLDVIVVDVRTNKVIQDLKPGFAGAATSCADGNNNDCSGPDGVAVIDHKEIWVGDFPSRVWVLDAFTGLPVAAPANPISTGGLFRADELCFDPVDKIVAVVNNADTPPFITFISTTTKLVLGSIVFDGNGGRPNATAGSEQCGWNPRDGMIYLSIPELNGPGDNSVPGGVVVINPVTRAIVRTMVIPQSACSAPQGLAIGPPNQIGLGCNQDSTGGSNNAIISDTGAVLAAFPRAGGCDEVWFNPGNNKYFAACRSAPQGGSVFAMDADNFSIQALSTGVNAGTGNGANAHSVAADPVSNQVYVPISFNEPTGLCTASGAPGGRGCILVFAPVPQTPEPGCFTATVLGDINGDARSDILFRRTDGALTLWLMNGSTASVTGLGTIGPEWNIAGAADVNGDGRADIVFRRYTDGAIAVWLMNGTQVVQAAGLGAVGPEWKIVGVRDFDGDGKADLLFRRSTDGALAIWFLNGTTVTLAAGIGTVGLEFQVFAAADFNGDGKADILFRRLDGSMSMWLMNGTQVLQASGVGTVGTEFHIAAVGDFNGDKKADILFRRDDGSISMWVMNGTSVVSATGVANVSTDWTAADVGDLDGNGTADLVWRNAFGGVSFWFLNGPTVTSVVGGASSAVGNEFKSCQHEPTGPV